VKRTARIIALAAAAASILLNGCIYVKTHPAGLIPSAHRASPSYETLGEAEGESSAFTLLWFAPVTTPVSVDTAINTAIRSKGGDNLIGASVWNEKQILIIGTIDTLYVKGTVVRSATKE
jgi:hypothetical protein